MTTNDPPDHHVFMNELLRGGRRRPPEAAEEPELPATSFDGGAREPVPSPIDMNKLIRRAWDGEDA